MGNIDYSLHDDEFDLLNIFVFKIVLELVHKSSDIVEWAIRTGNPILDTPCVHVQSFQNLPRLLLFRIFLPETYVDGSAHKTSSVADLLYVTNITNSV